MATKYLLKFRCANHSDEPLKAKIVSAMASTIFESHLHCTTIEFEQIFGCHFPENPKFINYVSFFAKRGCKLPVFSAWKILFITGLCSGARLRRLHKTRHESVLMGLGLFPLGGRRKRLAYLFCRRCLGR